jgi:RNA polymerase sigma-70 factor (ECF subfamily)
VTQTRLNYLLGKLHRAAAGPASDGELLSRFVERREEGAFAALVRRHGPMVLGVCRRILGNAHDAEDAFQATFLVLVRKAASLHLRDAVGGWLHGVACRTALAARARRARLRRHERQVNDMPAVEASPSDLWEELRPLLDREVDRLPDIYRLAIILCDLEGKSRKAAAEQLGVPEGTLSSRLAAARKRLAQRLSRDGMALSAGALAVLMSKNATAAMVPAALVESTTRAALLGAAGQAAAVSGAVAALTEGVLKTMFLAKLKTVTVVLLGVAVLGLGTGKLYYAADTEQPGPVAAARDRSKPVADGRTQQGQQAAQAVAEQERDRVRQLEQELRDARDLEQKLKEELAEAQARQQGQAANTARRQQLQMKLHVDYHTRRQQLQMRLKQLEAKREDVQVMLKQLNAEREQVQAQLQELEAQAQRDMESLRQKEAEITRQQAIRPEQRKAPQPTAGAKLDRILDKLEQLERRLDRLERANR